MKTNRLILTAIIIALVAVMVGCQTMKKAIEERDGLIAKLQQEVSKLKLNLQAEQERSKNLEKSLAEKKVIPQEELVKLREKATQMDEVVNILGAKDPKDAVAKVKGMATLRAMPGPPLVPEK